MKRTVNVEEIIDQRKLGWFHVQIIVLCFFSQFIDGFDTQAIAYVAPSLTKAWHLANGALGSVFGIGIFGTMVGSLLIGPLADWFGRKMLMIVGLVIIAVFTFWTAQSGTLHVLLIIRFLTGLGLGAVTPSAIVITSEYAPSRSRATMVTLMACGYAIGAAFGGLVTSFLLSFGWQAIFYIGALAPLLLAVALMIWLPESIRLMVLKGADGFKIARVLRRIDTNSTYDYDVEFTVQHAARRGMPLFQLFRENRAWTTALLWTTFFMNLLALNFLNNWLPSVIHGTGIPVQQAIRLTTIFQFAGMFGVVILGALSDKFGYYKVLFAGFGLAAICTAMIGTVGTSIMALAVAICGAGFCVIGVQMTQGALAATLYPTAIRSTGSSWAFGIGRLGAILGPVIGGIFLSMHMSLHMLFYVAAGPAICGALGILALARVQQSRVAEAGFRHSEVQMESETM